METPTCPTCFQTDEVNQTGSRSAFEYHDDIREQSPRMESDDRLCFWACTRCGVTFETHSEHAHLNSSPTETSPPDVELDG